MATNKKSPATTIVALREEIVRVGEHIAAIHTAPLPIQEAIAALAAAVAEIAARHEPGRLLPQFSRRPAPTGELVELILGDPRAEPRRLQGAILAVLGDAFMARWREALEGYYAEHPDLERTAIPWGERPARIAALEATLRALEIQEEKSILKAASYGIRIDRREDMDVAVLFDPAVLEETTP